MPSSPRHSQRSPRLQTPEPPVVGAALADPTPETAELAEQDEQLRLSQLAAAIGEPARARMLCCLLDGHARTATELGVVGGTGASTASGHLAKLVEQGLLSVLSQGRHRYFRLAGEGVARALEALMVVAGTPRVTFTPSTPLTLREARTCYDHLAGAWAVSLHDAFLARGWLVPHQGAYRIGAVGDAGFSALGMDMPAIYASRRQLACACMDWSERRPHLAGALGAALLKLALSLGWVQRELDSRGLRVTSKGRTGLRALLDAGPSGRPDQ